MKEDKHYVTKDELWLAIKEFYDNDDKMSDKLGIMINQIANKLMTRQNFSGYPYKSEMIGDAILRMVSTLSEKKFNLWSDKKSKKIEKRSFYGYEFKGKFELEENQVLHVKNMNSLNTVSVYEKKFDMFFHDVDENGNSIKNNVWERVGPATGVNIVKSNQSNSVDVYTFIESEKEFNGRPVYESGVVYDFEGNVITEKSNAFGYLSFIAHNEAITRIKKEKKNTQTIKIHQENEFVMFMADNCEMNPQRLFDDSYEIDNV